MKVFCLSVFSLERILLSRWGLIPSVFIVMWISCFSITASADIPASGYTYCVANDCAVHFGSPGDACAHFASIAGADAANFIYLGGPGSVYTGWSLLPFDDGRTPYCQINYTNQMHQPSWYAQIIYRNGVGSCPINTHLDAKTQQCIGNPKNDGHPTCSSSAGTNPINVGVGNKFQLEADYKNGSASLLYQRAYNSDGLTPPANLGNSWISNYDREVTSTPSTTTFSVMRPDGKAYSFTLINNVWTSDTDISDRLSGNTTTGWTYRVAADDSVETYNTSGQLIRITNQSGQTQSLTYSDASTPTTIAPKTGLLIRVTDSFGHQLSFTYDSLKRISTLMDPNGGIYLYSYDSVGNLISVKYPDGKVRTYVYNEPNNTSGANLPNALTGILDENGTRFATYKYDASGRAISSEHNLANGTPVEKVSIAYSTDTNGNVVSSAVTDALGTTRNYSFTNILGVVKNTGVTQPCNSGCGAASATTYDVNGNIASKTDFNNNVTNYIYDLNRNLETSRTEAYGTPLARTLTTQWHAVYRLPTLITEPGKTTAFTYDASGNLLSKTMTDTNLNKSRTWSWTYNNLGQVLSANGPRTDVNDVTTYTYYASASSAAGSVHAIGDLATVTNALGHVTSMTNYDLNGRPLTIVDPNNVITTLTYTPRGWLKSRTVNNAQTTTYDYDGVGQLTQITLPDNSALKYTYDTAHRLTDIEDGYVSNGVLTLSGNKMHYTLDAMGNRLKEDTQDPSNTIAKTRSRVFDALNRLQKDIGGTSPSTQMTQYSYDNNGNLKTITDPLNHITTNGYDALNRLISVTDPANGVSTTTYDALDQITQVKDPRLVTTNYTVDGLGNVTLTQSPDSGNTNTVYDAAGNVIQKTDARGVVSNYSYDALNRLTGITYPASPGENLSLVYDNPSANYGKGRLYYLSDNNASLVFGYDAYGNLTLQSDVSAAMWALSSYQYDSANRLSRIKYPNGRIVLYTRNALGQIVQVHTQDNLNAALQTIVSNVTYEPFGPLKSVTFANGVTTAIQHDADYRVGRITTTATPGFDYVYSYNAAGNLTNLTDQLGSANKTYNYDALDRVTSENSPPQNYQYDAGGNRLLAGVTLYSAPQSYAANSNRQTDYAGTPIAHDAAGNITASASVAMTYNHANRLSQSTANNIATTYQYTGLGWRNLKTTGTQRTHYAYLPNGNTLAQMQLNADGNYNQGVDYLWLDDMPIAQIKTTYAANSTPSTRRLTYIHADHLNTPKLMTDSTKKVVWKWSRDAYGLFAPSENPDGDGVSDKLDLRFPGYVYDSETGLFCSLYRCYDPVSGRFTQFDLIGPTRDYSSPVLQVAINAGVPLLSEQENSGLNQPFAYANNNPVKFTDPFGLENGDPWPSLYLNRYNTGEASAFPLINNNARYQACVQECMEQGKKKKWDEPAGSEVVCKVVGGAVAAGTKSRAVGAAVNKVCEPVARHEACSIKCSEKEQELCPK